MNLACEVIDDGLLSVFAVVITVHLSTHGQDLWQTHHR